MEKDLTKPKRSKRTTIAHNPTSNHYQFCGLTSLEQVGAMYLTGERCAYKMRAMYDCTLEFVQLLGEYIDIPFDQAFINKHSNNEQKNIRIMMGESLAIEMWKYCMLRKGFFVLKIKGEGWENMIACDKQTLLKYQEFDLIQNYKSPVPDHQFNISQIIGGK